MGGRRDELCCFKHFNHASGSEPLVPATLWGAAYNISDALMQMNTCCGETFPSVGTGWKGWSKPSWGRTALKRTRSIASLREHDQHHLFMCVSRFLQRLREKCSR